jgi:hypothetical protein
MASILKVDTIQDQSGNNIINENADTITIGASGDTITIPAGATLANNGTVTGIPASAIDSGTIATARLGTGTASSSTFLRGDQTYAAAGLSGWSEDGANNNLLPASASAGIYLGVNSATAANLLDDYEEGTFTPTFVNGAGFDSISIVSQTGTYTKIGTFVQFNFKVELGSASKNGNRIEMSGLPFTTENVSQGSGAIWNLVSSKIINDTSVNLPVLWIPPNNTKIEYFKTNGSSFTGNDINSTSNTDFYISGSYQVA